MEPPLDTTLTAEQEIRNATGLHARPCHAIAAMASDFESSLRVTCGSRSADGKSILGLMTLGAAQGDVLQFQAQGRDASALLEALCDLVATGFRERS